MKNIFVEIEGVLAEVVQDTEFKSFKPIEETVSIINCLSECHNVILFSTRREEERLAVEDWLMSNGVTVDDVLLRDDHDFSQVVKSRDKIINDFYNDHEDKKLLKTLSVWTNHEKTIESLRDEGIVVVQTGW